MIFSCNLIFYMQSSSFRIKSFKKIDFAKPVELAFCKYALYYREYFAANCTVLYCIALYCNVRESSVCVFVCTFAQNPTPGGMDTPGLRVKRLYWHIFRHFWVFIVLIIFFSSKLVFGFWVFANQAIVHNGGVSRGRGRGCGC